MADEEREKEPWLGPEQEPAEPEPKEEPEREEEPWLIGEPEPDESESEPKPS